MRISAKLNRWLTAVIRAAVEPRLEHLWDQIEVRLLVVDARVKALEQAIAALPEAPDLAPVMTAIRSLEVALHPETVATRLRDPIETMVAEALRVPLPPRPRTRTYGPAGRAFSWMVRQA